MSFLFFYSGSKLTEFFSVSCVFLLSF